MTETDKIVITQQLIKTLSDISYCHYTIADNYTANDILNYCRKNFSTNCEDYDINAFCGIALRVGFILGKRAERSKHKRVNSNK